MSQLLQFDTNKSKQIIERIVKKRPKTYLKTVRVASFGCGVDSVAGIILMVFLYGWDYFDEIIFCDTGAEKKKTYTYLDYLTKTLNWPVTVLRSRYGNIFDYYYKKFIYPTRWARDCTGKFKIDVHNGYLRKKYGKNTKFQVHLFIDFDEFTRVGTSKYDYCDLIHPLVDKGITRQQCKDIITSCGMPVPVKSGCFFCPFTPPEIWAKMKLSQDPDEREYYAKSLQMQKNSKMRNKKKFPLMSIMAAESGTLDASCGCFNFNAPDKDIDYDNLYKRGFSM